MCDRLFPKVLTNDVTKQAFYLIKEFAYPYAMYSCGNEFILFEHFIDYDDEGNIFDGFERTIPQNYPEWWKQ